MNVVIPKNTTVTVGNLIVGDNTPTFTIGEGAQLIILNQTFLKSGSTLNIKGSFSINTLVNNSGNLNGSGNGSIQIRGEIVSSSGKFTLSENSILDAWGDLWTSGATYFTANKNSRVSIEGNLSLTGGYSGPDFTFSENSQLSTGGHLEVSGSVSLTFDQTAVGKIGKGISLVEGASINLKQQTDFRSGGDLSLSGGALLIISGTSEGLIGGNVNMPNGEIHTSGSSALFIDGKLTAYRDRQENGRQESSISICNYPHSTQLESPYITRESGAYYGMGCFLLPVDWLGIDVAFDNAARANLLTWATSKKRDNSHFEIERSIGGVESFEKVGKIAGRDWTETISHYSFEDRNLPAFQENIFYRIKQVDFNG